MSDFPDIQALIGDGPPEICETCHWWDSSTSLETDDDTGLCRARSPIADRRSGRAIWPFTCAGDWCRRWKRDASAEAPQAEDLAGDIDPHDDVEKTVVIVRSARAWTFDVDGRLHGLVGGDMGYAATHIVVSAADIEAAARHLRNQEASDES